MTGDESHPRFKHIVKKVGWSSCRATLWIKYSRVRQLTFADSETVSDAKQLIEMTQPITHLRQDISVEERRQNPALLARRPVEFAVLLVLRVISVVGVGTFVDDNLRTGMDGGVVHHGNWQMENRFRE